MDYFSELIKSYYQLKKRTFKLRYIAEGEGTDDEYAQGKMAMFNQVALKAAKASLDKAGKDKENKEEVIPGVTLWTNLEGGKTANFNAGGNTKMWTIVDANGVETEDWPLYVKKFADPTNSEAVGQAGTDAEGNVPEDDLTDVQKAERDIKQQEEAAAAEERAKYERIGGVWEAEHGAPMDEVVKENLLQSEKSAREFCKKQADAGKEESSMCKGNNLMRYIGGASNWGLEHKLAYGRGIKTEMTPDKEGKMQEKANVVDIKTVLNTALVQEATESMALLTDFLGNEGGNCEDVKNRVALYRSGGQDGLILFGGNTNEEGNPSEGIFISPLNPLQKTALKAMKDNCPAGLRNVTGSQFSQKAKNAVKGTFYELTIQAAVSINAADRLPNGTASEQWARKKAIKEAVGMLAEKLKEKIGELREIAAEDGPDDIARDLEAQFDHEVIREQMDLLESFVGRCSIQGDEAAQLSMRSGGADIENDEFACNDAGGTWERDDQTLKNWVLDEIVAVRRAIQVIDADDAEATGQSENRTGGREDTKFIFNQDKDGLTAEERCKKAADLMGGKPVLVTSGPHKGAWSLGAGQKRIEKMGKIKIGELNNEDRREEIYKGNEDIKNPVEGGFHAKIRNMQFNGANTAREKAAEEYAFGEPDGLETRIKKATKGLESDTAYVDGGGKIKNQSATSLLTSIQQKFAGLLSFDQLKNSIVGKALMKGGGQHTKRGARDAEWRDFNDPTVRKRAQEAVERTARFAILRKDLKDPKKKQEAQDYIIRNSLMTGANAVDMGQMITDDTGKTLTIAHNKGLEAMCDAHSKGLVDFKIKPGGTRVVMTINDPGPPKNKFHGMEVKWSQEGTWAGESGDPDRNTRSQTDYPYDTVKTLARDNGVRGQQIRNRRASRNDIRAQQAQAEAQPIAANTFHKYMQGQLNLLEVLLNQANKNQIL